MSSPSTDLTSINVSLPRGQREFVESEARRTGCTTTSEYVRRLIADAEKRASNERLEQKLLEGLESGATKKWKKEDWADLRRDVLKGLEQRKKRS